MSFELVSKPFQRWQQFSHTIYFFIFFRAFIRNKACLKKNWANLAFMTSSLFLFLYCFLLKTRYYSISRFVLLACVAWQACAQDDEPRPLSRALLKRGPPTRGKPTTTTTTPVPQVTFNTLIINLKSRPNANLRYKPTSHQVSCKSVHLFLRDWATDVQSSKLWHLKYKTFTLIIIIMNTKICV